MLVIEDSSLMWNHRLPVSREIAACFKDNQYRVRVTLNAAFDFATGLQHDGEGDFYIKLNKEIREKLHLNAGDEVEVKLETDTSKYGMPLPVEFEELLGQDVEGANLFDALTPGKRRNLIYIVSKPKSTDKRLEKALAILDYLKTSRGKLDYKELHLALKNSRFNA